MSLLRTRRLAARRRLSTLSLPSVLAPTSNLTASNGLSARRRLSTQPQPSVLAPMTNLSASHGVPPLRLVRGHGIHVVDDHGKEYIEAMSGLWCAGLGWGNEELVQASADQMRRLSFYHGFADRRVPVVEELAAALLERAPPQLQRGRVFFGQSGSDANDTQVIERLLRRPPRHRPLHRLYRRPPRPRR
jgi:4-aminobutyrate--pyruvate transaminase